MAPGGPAGGRWRGAGLAGEERPERRLGIFRTVLRTGAQGAPRKRRCYISLAGEVLPCDRGGGGDGAADESSEGFAQSGADAAVLASLGVAKLGSLEAVAHLLPVFREAPPPASRRDLAAWLVPPGVRRAYAAAGVRGLYGWQADLLQRALPPLAPGTAAAAGGAGACGTAAAGGGAGSAGASGYGGGFASGSAGFARGASGFAGGAGAPGSGQSCDAPPAVKLEVNAGDGTGGFFGGEEPGPAVPGVAAAQPAWPRSNLVYGAPTSGGKSLIGELVMLHAALYRGKCSLLILPHVALCQEKARQLNAVFGRPLGLRIGAFHSTEGSASTWHPGVDIAVCTIEKANGLFNRLVRDAAAERELLHELATGTDLPAADVSRLAARCTPDVERLGIVVADEIHLAADPHRGYLLELLLSKINEYNRRRGEGRGIQILALSATLPNLGEVGQWLRAFVYETNVRPAPLNFFFKFEDRVIPAEALQAAEPAEAPAPPAGARDAPPGTPAPAAAPAAAPMAAAPPPPALRPPPPPRVSAQACFALPPSRLRIAPAPPAEPEEAAGDTGSAGDDNAPEVAAAARSGDGGLSERENRWPRQPTKNSAPLRRGAGEAHGVAESTPRHTAASAGWGDEGEPGGPESGSLKLAPAAPLPPPPAPAPAKVVTDTDHLALLTWQAVARNRHVLIFCATKTWCSNAAAYLAKMLPLYREGRVAPVDDGGGGVAREYLAKLGADFDPRRWREGLRGRRDLCSRLALAFPLGCNCATLQRSVVEGVAYHHSGLPTEVRDLLESAYCAGTLLVLCATSTLAVGVNLPVSRVIFRNLQIGRGELDATKFRQMAGRAGRMGYANVRGEAILLCQSQRDIVAGLELLSAEKMDPVKSALASSPLALCRLVLELFALDFARTSREAAAVVLRSTLLAEHLRGVEDEARAAARQNVERLIDKCVAFLMRTGLADAEPKARGASPAAGFPPAPGAGLPASDAAAAAAAPPPLFLLRLFDFNDASSALLPADVRMLRHRSLAPLRAAHAALLARGPGAPLHSTENFADRATVVRATPLGLGLVECGADLTTGVELALDVRKALLLGLQVDTAAAVHTLFLVAPLASPALADADGWQGLAALLERLSPPAARAAAFANVDAKFARTMVSAFNSGSAACSPELRRDQFFTRLLLNEATVSEAQQYLRVQAHERFVHALALNDVLLEVPVSHICSRRFAALRLTPGGLQTLRKNAALTAGVCALLAQHVHEWSILEILFRETSQRISGAYRCAEEKDVFPELQQVELIQGARAAALGKAGFRTLQALATADVGAVAQVLQAAYPAPLDAGTNAPRAFRQLAAQAIGQARAALEGRLVEELKER